MTVPGRSSTIVVIPAYNEEATLPGVLADLAAIVPELDVVVIDDGSVDATSRVTAEAGVPSVRLPFNLGIGGALRAGYRYAVEAGYERAVQFDADGQHRADQIPILLDALDDGADLAFGNRFGEAGDYEVGFGRGIAMRLLRFGVRLMCRQRFVDTSSGFRAIDRRLIEIFAKEYPVEYMDSVETLVAVCRGGYVVSEVEVTMEERAGGEPSQRHFRLAYHYARLIVALLGSSRRAIPPRR